MVPEIHAALVSSLVLWGILHKAVTSFSLSGVRSSGVDLTMWNVLTISFLPLAELTKVAVNKNVRKC